MSIVLIDPRFALWTSGRTLGAFHKTHATNHIFGAMHSDVLIGTRQRAPCRQSQGVVALVIALGLSLHISEFICFRSVR